MAGNITSMSVNLEDTVRELSAGDRLKWDGAHNDANYYHESITNGFFDGLAACLDALADRFDFVKKEGADSPYFLRDAAAELWSLKGEEREWKDRRGLPIATAMLHLVTALEIESRRVLDHSGPPHA
ncbi:MAG: hypothetical protein WC538_12655 [Thermoanaerobaculia bacterium]|jgi:hypothetical protein